LQRSKPCTRVANFDTTNLAGHGNNRRRRRQHQPAEIEVTLMAHPDKAEVVNGRLALS
jgi:hypothetical protein